jgi:hypothetical protein
VASIVEPLAPTVFVIRRAPEADLCLFSVWFDKLNGERSTKSHPSELARPVFWM